MSEQRLRAAQESCAKALREMWEREGVVDPPEPPRHYVVTFDCVPSVAERVMQYIAEQPTANRSFRRYEMPAQRRQRCPTRCGASSSGRTSTCR